jgi:pappalysin-1
MTDRSNTATTVASNRKYISGKWSHLAATYNGSRMTLYVNGAQVASVADQQGSLFAQPLAECKSLRIGGDMKSTSLYRGALNNFQIWNKVLSHEDIIRSMHNRLNATGQLFIGSHLERKHELWRKAGHKTPGHVTMDQSEYDNDIGPVVPPCGETICDDPKIVTSYLYRWQLKQKKSLVYRVINIMNDNGTGAMVSNEQIRLQDDALRVAYKRYNISWHLETLEIRNTSLRSRTVLFGCDPDKVADGLCQLECNHTATGYDGGDCHDIMATCDPDDVANGVCDVTCNTVYEEWDGGDCCGLHDVTSCLDPASPYR